MPLQITNRPPSRTVRAELAEQGRPVLLAFSRGKDSIAAWLACRDSGIPVVPYHWEGVPGLSFVRESLDYFEDYFGTRIATYPHPAFYRRLKNRVFQPPERWEVIEALDFPTPSIRQWEDRIRTDLGLPPDSWCVDGARAADTLARRTALTKLGYLRGTTMKASLIGDWRKHEVYATIERHGVELPIDYGIWGRSFDGIGYDYLAPLKRHLPDDFERVLDWFPLADLELMRRDLEGALA